MKKQPQFHSFWGNTDQKLIAVAHRGGDGAGREKENSLAAFKAAYDMGYRWFETDVVSTLDGKLLAIHGRGYQLRPNKDLPPRTLLQKLSYERVKEEVRVGKEPPILLTELMDTFLDVKFFLDPKTYKAGPILADLLITRPEYLTRVLVGSFLPFNTSRVKRMVKRGTGKELSVSILGPLRACSLRLSVTFPWLTPLSKYQLTLSGADSVHLPYKWVLGRRGYSLLTKAQGFGLKVGVYTPNEVATLRACMDKGIDIIMSDSVGLLKQITLEKDARNPSVTGSP